jgi:mono/diheme cytochrome c family protein
MVKGFFVAAIIVISAFGYIPNQDDSIKRGKEVYTANCLSCHMENGMGLEGSFPPLAKADYLMKDPKRAIGIILNGQTEELKVNGKKYSAVMPPQNYLSDEQIADVINYTCNTWGNKTKVKITPAMVKAARK